MSATIFLPGAGGDPSFWNPVAERLGPAVRATLLGWPGFGVEPPDPAVRSLEELYAWTLRRLPEERVALVAQSMGGALALRLALEHPGRVTHLVLAATSGGVDVRALGGSDWRPGYRRDRPGVPPWFVDDRSDLSHRLGEVMARTLLLWGDADEVSPLRVGELLASRIPGATLRVVRGGDHGFAHDRADEVAAEIAAFLGA